MGSLLQEELRTNNIISCEYLLEKFNEFILQVSRDEWVYIITCLQNKNHIESYDRLQ